MRELFEEYGGAVLTVVATLAFLIILALYFNTDNGWIKKMQSDYTDTVCQTIYVEPERLV